MCNFSECFHLKNQAYFHENEWKSFAVTLMQFRVSVSSTFAEFKPNASSNMTFATRTVLGIHA